MNAQKKNLLFDGAKIYQEKKPSIHIQKLVSSPACYQDVLDK